MSKDKYIKVLEKAKKKLIYLDEEYEKLYLVAEEIKEKVVSWLENKGIEGEVILAGSLAKKTMVKGYSDVDIFIRHPIDYTKEQLKNYVISMGYDIFGKNNVMMRFAEHPYIEAQYRNITFSIVPSYKVELYRWRSAVDRSYYHFKYVVKKLEEKVGLNNDMTLLKAFLRRIGIYGAEVAVKGFSGYLSELLIIYYGSLLELFRNVSRWRPRILIDIEGYYDNRRSDAYIMFKEPLIVIDPVDRGRNVASAVSKRSLSLFISAVKAFLDNPDLEFFNIHNPRHIYYNESIWRDKPLIGILINHYQEIPDILYSQLEKVTKKIMKSLKAYGIDCYKWHIFSNYRNKSIILMNISTIEATKYYVRNGPYPYMDGESSFIEKNRDALIWIDEDGRWKILETRAKIDVKDIINDTLKIINLPSSLKKDDVKITLYYSNELMKTRDPLVKQWIKEFSMKQEFWTVAK